jgi:hypothetical protein
LRRNNTSVNAPLGGIKFISQNQGILKGEVSLYR